MTFKNKGYILIIAFLAIFTSASLACSLPLVIKNSQPVEVSEEAAQSLETNLKNSADELKDTGQLELTISESELTSFIATRLNQEENPVFYNPQIMLRDGKVRLTADIKQGNLTLPLNASLTLTADGNGGIDYHVDSASVGPLKLPAGIVNEITNQVQTTFGSNISGQIPNLYIEELTISEGQLLVKGHSR